MIPKLARQNIINQENYQFLEALEKTQFSGEIRADFATRLLASTDNSIYQILPPAVIFPKTEADIVQIFRLANQETFSAITFSVRGGGTGTNGQSLSAGIIIDCSKYMNQILELNLEEGWVRVQPGVVLDQLNAYLKPQAVFFAPTVAPSDRATIGGTINTDACGKGSRIYGRTSDHILELSWVLADGTQGCSQAVNLQHLSEITATPDRIGEVYQQVDEIITNKRELIEQVFPKLSRFMTGYNLAKIYSRSRDGFDINRLLAGSEGTLAVITEAKLKLTPIPKFQQLVAIHYQSFDDALKDTEELLKLEPEAIETLDEKILDLAKSDAIFLEVKDFIGTARAINLVEFVGSDRDSLKQKISDLLQRLETHRDRPQAATSYYLAQTETEIARLWELRKRGVALLGNLPGQRKPIPFIEDTAVPPPALASYIRDLKALLADYQLDYAMYGHVDVGCVHVRPALDMKVPQDERLIREISDQVVALVRHYGGVMWGEHGKGFRSEYTPLFFGEELYEDLRRIKAIFDPNNKLNPGKIVTPYGSSEQTVRLEAPLRGHFDRQVKAELRSEYEGAFSCNGNGACFNVHPDSVICPSAKETRDRIQSPKGRASLLREWLRQLSVSQIESLEMLVERGNREQGTGNKIEEKLSSASSLLEKPGSFPVKLWNTLSKQWRTYDYSHEVYAGMAGCLSCKACASQCPLHVDIPDLKAKFLELYHTRYLRSGRDYLTGNIETLASWQSLFPGFANAIAQNPATRWGMKQFLGLVDPPAISSQTLQQGLAARQAPTFDILQLSDFSAVERVNSVILIQDAFTSFYEANLVLDTYDFLTGLGYSVYVAPFFGSGKPLHVRGFLREFQAIAQKNIAYLTQLAQLDIPLIGIEPSIVLTYRDEYAKLLNTQETFRVQLLQEFLVTQTDRLRSRSAQCQRRSQRPHRHPNSPYYLLSHCTEKTAALESQKQWQQVFQAMGLDLTLVTTGCCGMAGIYGHEAEHHDSSKGIYQMSWEQYLPSNTDERPRFLVTGYSCRSQVQRFAGWLPSHPVQVLGVRR